MNYLTRRVIPVFALNAILSIVGFALAMAHFGIPHVLLHPITGALWTMLLFVQMVLAAKKNPIHKIVGRIALIVLGISIYAALRGVAMSIGGESPMPNSVLFLFVATGIVTLVYASMGIAFVVNKQFEAHSTAMLLAGSVTMAAGVSRAAFAFEAIIGIPFQIIYSLSALSMAAILWRWRPSQSYLIGSYLLLMTCVIYLR
ncbi:MAG: hypothetical protein OEY19_12420 [Gammaproteobacteria bacterium]|nr:hypothetical protein [Gammaproteobacteria bacterium]MDH5629613.1 hypothetical protein [Gammaproteobacteria bacterium]